MPGVRQTSSGVVQTTAGVVDTVAIPDSEIHHHPGDEGSGTTITDQIGSADITLTADNWTAVSGYTGGTGYNLTGSNEASASLTQPSAHTIFVRFIYDDNQSNFRPIWSHNDRPALGWHDGNDEWNLSDPDLNSAVVAESKSSMQGNIRIAVSRIDSSTAELDVYDNSLNLIGSDSFSNPNTNYEGGTIYFGTYGSVDRRWTGSIDPNFSVFNEVLTDTQVGDVLNVRFA